jgi:TrmH family RNA methyltransferase
MIENALTAAQVKAIAALKSSAGRAESQLILVEGRHPIEEAVRAGLQARYYCVLKAASPGSLPEVEPACVTSFVDAKTMARLATTDSPPPCLAVFARPQTPDWKGAKTLLVLENLQDPGNVGTLTRAAVAFGIEALLCLGESADPFSPKVIRASAGLVFALPVATFNPINPAFEALNSGPWHVFAARAHDGSAQSYRRTDFSQPFALVLGNEGRGLSPLWQAATGITIPTAARAESLNVAMSGAIILAEVAAQRGANAHA